MSLLEEIQEFLVESPDDVWDIPRVTTARLVETEIHDERRWYNIRHSVFNRGDEYVLVEHCEAATELQEGGDFDAPVVMPVEPYEIVVTRYRPC